MVNRFRDADEMRDLAPPARRRSDMVLTIGRSGSERNKIMSYSIEAGPARKQMIFLPPLYKIIMERFVDRPFSQVDIMDLILRGVEVVFWCELWHARWCLLHPQQTRHVDRSSTSSGWKFKIHIWQNGGQRFWNLADWCHGYLWHVQKLVFNVLIKN